jgi:hypothetical protein
VSDGLLVHTMENGHLLLLYAPDTDPAEARQLERLAKRYGRDVVLAPYPGLRTGLALTAWGRIDLLPRYDESRATTFVERLRGRYHHGWTRPTDCPSNPTPQN